MRFAFCVFSYYPFGGMERNLLRIALHCVAHGHQVAIFTQRWEGEQPEGLEIITLPVTGWSNHRRAEQFAASLPTAVQGWKADLVVGFNRMPGLDLYYAADVCFAYRKRSSSRWLRWTRRYQTFMALERAVFDPQSLTHIMHLAESEKAHYQAMYQTPEARFHYLPPGIDKTRIRQVATRARSDVRLDYGVSEQETLLLLVGSDFKRKGVDRGIIALAALPEVLRRQTVLMIIGQGKARRLQALARKLGVADQVKFVGPRSDVPRFYAAADALVHPARVENTGNVILEALVAGLPVLATGACGYAFHLGRADAGLVVPEPFSQRLMNQILETFLQPKQLRQWGENAYHYSESQDLYSAPESAVFIMEQLTQAKEG